MSDEKNAKPKQAATKPCAICGRPATEEFHPFCSKRCRTVDLNCWLGGAYAIPGDSAPTPDDEEG